MGHWNREAAGWDAGQLGRERGTGRDKEGEGKRRRKN